MTTTLTSIGIDPTSHGYVSSDLLLAGKLTALYEYTKSLEERVKDQSSVSPAWDKALREGAHFDPGFDEG